MKSWKEITTSAPETAERRAAYEEGRREVVAEIIAYNLAELRKLRSITQVELARQLGIAQPTLSGMERRSDFQLSTLRDYVEGLGGHLEVSAIFDDIRVPVTLFLSAQQDSQDADGSVSDLRDQEADTEDLGSSAVAGGRYPGSSLSVISDRKEGNPMAKSRHTGIAAAKAASKVLRDKRTSATSKRAAGSALSQAAPRRGGKRK